MVTQRHRVLVVDDEQSIQAALTDLLEFEGYEVRAAHDGQEALEILSAWRPEAILLDLMMPVMDARAFCLALHARSDDSAAIPLIVLSGARDTAIQARAIGASAHITKPFDIDDLLDVLAAVRHATGPRVARNAV